jgi:O-antigen/teichoic acid export membrane protein
LALKKNLFYNLLLSLSQIFFPLISIPYISRILEAEGIGKVNSIDSLTYFIVVIAELGFSTYAVREISKLQSNKQALQQRTNQLISLHIVSTLFVTILYSIALYFLWLKTQSTTMLWFSALFYIGNVFNCEWYYWGTEKFKYIAIRSIITRLIGLFFIFVLIKLPTDFEKYYGIIVCTMMANIVLNAMQILPNFKLSFSNLKSDFKNCLPVYFIGLIHSITLMLDNVILGFTSTFVAVAYYSNAAKMVRISGALITDSFTVFFPRATVLIHQEKKEELESMYEKTIQLIWILSIPLSIGLYIFADFFTAIYFGKTMQLVANNLLILSVYPIIKSFSLFFSRQILMSNHQDKTALKGYVLGSGVFIIACILFSYFWQDKGCSFALILAEMSMLLYFYLATKKYLLNIPFHVLKYVLLATVTWILFLGIKTAVQYYLATTLFSLILAIVLALFFYLLYLVFIVKNEFVHTLFALLKNKFNRNE